MLGTIIVPLRHPFGEGGARMPRNLRNLFRSELIRQRQLGAKTPRNSIKRNKGGKMADYRHIYSDNSYKDHWARAQKFAQYLRTETGLRKMAEITPEIASQYLIKQRDNGYSASTIGADALAINHLMIGSGNWEESQRIIKSNIANMPKRSSTYQQYKPLDSYEWRNQHQDLYAKYRDQIDTIRAFGLRRRELTSGTSLGGKDGLGSKTLFRAKNGLLVAQTMGKGGKLRFAEVRRDMAGKMEQKFGQYARDISLAAKNSKEFRGMIRNNRPFFKPFGHRVPTHIFRADYAQNKLSELNQKHYSGYHAVKKYRRAGHNAQGKQLYSSYMKQLNNQDQYRIGAYKASFGAFFELSRNLGHNRLDVLNAYLGTGR